MKSVRRGRLDRQKGGQRLDALPMQRIDLQAILAKIRRDTQESDKFIAEQRKLIAEAAKLERDRAFLPWSVAATLLGAGAALFAAGAGFIKLIGG